MACTKILAGNLSCLKNLRLCFITRHSSTIQQELPPRKLFFKEPIQTRLYNLLLLDAKSISTEKLTQPSEVTYKLLEKDEIEDCMNKVCQVSLKKMQFPPVLDPFDNDDEYNIWSDTNDYYKTTNSNLSHKYGDKCDLFSTKYDFDTYDAFVDESHDREKQYTKDKIIKKDEIQGFSKFCHVFVDTSLDKQWLDRMIVIRETDGNLRESMNYERRRILNRILPQHYERRPYIPKMFTFNFKNMLDTKEYNYLLDNLLLQFECNDPIYVDIIERVYTSVNETFSFDLLHSTRHFGGLVFYLVRHGKIENLLKYFESVDTKLYKFYRNLLEICVLCHEIKLDYLTDNQECKAIYNIDEQSKLITSVSLKNLYNIYFSRFPSHTKTVCNFNTY